MAACSASSNCSAARKRAEAPRRSASESQRPVSDNLPPRAWLWPSLAPGPRWSQGTGSSLSPPTGRLSSSGPAPMLQTIPIDKIAPAEDNVRRRTNEIKDLAASIASVGVIEPLLVSPAHDGTFVVVAGHRRLLAARQAGITALPCSVRKLTDAERVEIMLAENVARCSLTPIEEASGYFRLIEFGLPLTEVGAADARPATSADASPSSNSPGRCTPRSTAGSSRWRKPRRCWPSKTTPT